MSRFTISENNVSASHETASIMRHDEPERGGQDGTDDWLCSREHGGQDVSLQLDALSQAGCAEEQIFLDVASGAYTTRPGLEACLQAVAAGDTLVVWRLDRLGRSMLHLVTVIADLGQRQVGFRSLCDGALDTTTATGELVFHIFSALAQFERRLIQERTRADSLPPAPGASMEDGKRSARMPPKSAWRTRYRETQFSQCQRSVSTCIARATFYRYVALARQAVGEAAPPA